MLQSTSLAPGSVRTCACQKNMVESRAWDTLLWVLYAHMNDYICAYITHTHTHNYCAYTVIHTHTHKYTVRKSEINM